MTAGLHLRRFLEEALLVSPPALLPGERPLGFRRLPAPEGAEEDEELLEELEVDAIGGGTATGTTGCPKGSPDRVGHPNFALQGSTPTELSATRFGCEEGGGSRVARLGLGARVHSSSCRAYSVFPQGGRGR